MDILYLAGWAGDNGQSKCSSTTADKGLITWNGKRLDVPFDSDALPQSAWWKVVQLYKPEVGLAIPWANLGIPYISHRRCQDVGLCSSGPFWSSGALGVFRTLTMQMVDGKFFWQENCPQAFLYVGLQLKIYPPPLNMKVNRVFFINVTTNSIFFPCVTPLTNRPQSHMRQIKRSYTHRSWYVWIKLSPYLAKRRTTEPQ